MPGRDRPGWLSALEGPQRRCGVDANRHQYASMLAKLFSLRNRRFATQNPAKAFRLINL